MLLKKNFWIALLSLIFLPQLLFAQTPTLVPDTEVFEKATVLDVSSSGTTTIAGTETSAPTQILMIKVLDGVDVGKVATFKNDYIQLNEGDVFYVRHHQ
jgi:hypothetical protein